MGCVFFLEYNLSTVFKRCFMMFRVWAGTACTLLSPMTLQDNVDVAEPKCRQEAALTTATVLTELTELMREPGGELEAYGAMPLSEEEARRLSVSIRGSGQPSSQNKEQLSLDYNTQR